MNWKALLGSSLSNVPSGASNQNTVQVTYNPASVQAAVQAANYNQMLNHVYLGVSTHERNEGTKTLIQELNPAFQYFVEILPTDPYYVVDAQVSEAYYLAMTLNSFEGLTFKFNNLVCFEHEDEAVQFVLTHGGHSV
jgi:hypothetical protein